MFLEVVIDTLMHNLFTYLQNPGHDGNDIDADFFKELEGLSDFGNYFEMNDLDKPLNDSSAFPP
jgi:hypothetical protein